MSLVAYGEELEKRNLQRELKDLLGVNEDTKEIREEMESISFKVGSVEDRLANMR